MLPVITGHRVRLRPLKRADAESIQKNINHREVTRWIYVPFPYTMDHAYAWVRDSRAMARKDRSYPFGIELRSTGQIIGCIDLHNLDWQNKSAEVGYWLGKSYWRQGLMSEALQLILGFGFLDLRFNRIQARVHHPNKASSGLLLKNRFTFEGRWRKAALRRRRYYDFLWYSLLASERSGR